MTSNLSGGAPFSTACACAYNQEKMVLVIYIAEYTL